MKLAEATLDALATIKADPTSRDAQEAISLLEILARFMIEPPSLAEVRQRYKRVKLGLPSEAQAALAAECEALAPVDTLRKRLALLDVIKEYE